MHASWATPSPALLGAAAGTAMLLRTGKPPLSIWRGPREGAREVTSRWPREGSERFTPSCKCQKSTANSSICLQSSGHSMPAFPSAKRQSDSAWHSNLHRCCPPSTAHGLWELSVDGTISGAQTISGDRTGWKRLINLSPSAVIDHKGYLFNKGLELRFNWL